QLRHRLADIGLNHALRLGLRKRRHFVLKIFQIERERGADNIGPRRQKLPELHIARTERAQRRRQAMGLRGGWSLEQPRDPERAPRRKWQQHRTDHAEYAGAREHEAGADQAREMADRPDHNRQPECRATIPPVMGVNLTRRKPAVRIMSANTSGCGNSLIDSARYR